MDYADKLPPSPWYIFAPPPRYIFPPPLTNILTRSHFGDGQRFKTSNIYQLYSYLRSQEHDDDPRSLNSEGVLLYPAISFDIDEAAELQGHIVRFATIDLAAQTSAVVEQLRQLPLASRLGYSSLAGSTPMSVSTC